MICFIKMKQFFFQEKYLLIKQTNIWKVFIYKKI